jgi:hypothetical protein
MWLVYWFYTLAFALLVVLPAGAVLYRSLGHSLWAERMLDDFDLQWLAERLYETGGLPMQAVAPLIALVAAGYILLSTFLAGGSLTVFASKERAYRPGLFYEGCGRNFGRLFRLLLVSLVFYALVLAANAGLRAVGRRIWGEGMEERPLVIFGWFRTGIVVLLLLLVNMIFDYAKIRLVTQNSRQAARAALGSVSLVFRNLGRTAATYGTVALVGVGLALFYGALAGIVPRNLALGMALLLVLQQGFILSRIAVRLLFFASQLELYRRLVAAPAAVIEMRDLPPAALEEPQAGLDSDR